MNNTIKRTWNQGSMVNIEDLRGVTFQAESGAHTFVISAVDANNNPITLSGTPSGTMLRPDNTDQALTCSVSGGKVYATLPAGCYDVPGRAGITIFLTSGGQKVAIYAAVVSVTRTQSGTASPGTTASVVDLVNAIAAAVATIPASYTDLMSAMAPTYSSSGLYAAGSYAWYNGKLYRCTTAITSGETWTSGHWTLANLGSDLVDLKSAFVGMTGGIVPTWDAGYAYPVDGKFYPTNKKGKHTKFIPVTEGETINKNISQIPDVETDALFYTSNSTSAYLSYLNVSTARSFVVPATAVYMVIGLFRTDGNLEGVDPDVYAWRDNGAIIKAVEAVDAKADSIQTGLNNKYAELKKDVEETAWPTSAWSIGYVFPTDGAVYPNNKKGMNSGFIPVTPGEVIQKNFSAISDETKALFYSSNSVSGYMGTSYTIDITKKDMFVVPDGASYMIVGIYKQSGNFVGLDSDLKIKFTDSIENDYINNSYNTIRPVWSVGYAYPTDGKLYPANTHGLNTGFISVSPGDIIFKSISKVSTETNALFYSSNSVSTYLGTQYTLNVTNSDYFIVPEGANYMIVGIFKSDAHYTIKDADVFMAFANSAVKNAIEVAEAANKKISIGVHTNRYQNFGNFYIYGENETGSLILDNSGTYETPPIEISGGVISNVTVRETGGDTGHNAYCVHTDNDANIDNTLTIQNCTFESNSSHCIGVGTREGYKLKFINCIFKQTNPNSYCVYIHNTTMSEAPSSSNPAEIEFIGCTFVSDGAELLKLQDWSTNTDYCTFTFVNNVFSSSTGVVDDMVDIQYRGYDGQQEYKSQEFKHRFSLSHNSIGNTVPFLNYHAT